MKSESEIRKDQRRKDARAIRGMRLPDDTHSHKIWNEALNKAADAIDPGE